MNFDQYQALASRTAGNRFATPELELAVWALGIAGEAGEVADYIKKVLGHGHDLDTEKLKKELGDVLWYIAAIASYLHIPLDEVAQLNIDKLKARYPQGFSSECSINRKPE